VTKEDIASGYTS